MLAAAAKAQVETPGKRHPTNESTTMVEAMMAVVEVVVAPVAATVAAFFLMKSLLVETTTKKVRFRRSRRVWHRKWRRKCRLTHTRRKGKKRR